VSSIDYSFLLIRGLAITLWISWLALILAALIGALIGLGRTSKSWSIRFLTSVYTEFFRSIPVLVTLFFVYYGLTLLTGVNLKNHSSCCFSKCAL